MPILCPRIIVLALLAALGATGTTRAEIELRVSVKFFLDPDGNRPTGNVSTDEDVEAQVDLANQILIAQGRGYRMTIVEIAELTPSILNTCDKSLLQDVVNTFPEDFLYDPSAINYYVTHGGCAGSCSFPDSGDNIILIGQSATTTTFLHEAGHFFSLCHTQGCPCGSCASADEDECGTVPGDDGIGDTLPDLPCWNRNQIADDAFGTNYASATPAQQNLVNTVFFNIMSYHGTRDRFSETQLDVIADVANGARNNVASGKTRFVDVENDGPQFGSSAFPFETFFLGVFAANDGDIVLVRTGTYAETGVIGDDPDEAVLILPTRGTAVIGAP